MVRCYTSISLMFKSSEEKIKVICNQNHLAVDSSLKSTVAISPKFSRKVNSGTTFWVCARTSPYAETEAIAVFQIKAID